MPTVSTSDAPVPPLPWALTSPLTADEIRPTGATWTDLASLQVREPSCYTEIAGAQPSVYFAGVHHRTGTLTLEVAGQRTDPHGDVHQGIQGELVHPAVHQVRRPGLRQSGGVSGDALRPTVTVVVHGMSSICCLTWASLFFAVAMTCGGVLDDFFTNAAIGFPLSGSRPC